MQGQTIEAKIVVDAAQAVAQLAKFDQETKAAEKALRDADAATKAFEKSQRDAVAAVTAIDERIVRYQRDMVALASAIASGKGNTEAYKLQLSSMSKELDMMHGKTAKMSTSFHDVTRTTRNGGMAMLEFSRAFEDAQYGITGVLNNIPGLLASLGAGAGLAGVVSAAAVGVSMLVKHFGEVPKESKDAADAAKENLKSLKDELVRINKEIRIMAVGDYQASLDEAKPKVEAALKDINKKIEEIGGRGVFDTMMSITDGGKNLSAMGDWFSRMMMTAEQKALHPYIDPQKFKEIVDARSALQTQLTVIDANARKEGERRDQEETDKAIERANAQTTAEQKSVDDRKKIDQKRLDTVYSFRVHELEQEEKQLKAINDARRKAAKEAEEIELQRLGMHAGGGFAGGGPLFGAGVVQGSAGAQTELQIMAIEAEKNAAIAGDWSLAWTIAGREVADSLGGAAGVMNTSVGIAVAGIQQLTTDAITGQEHIAERFAALVMQQAGQSLISSGTELAGKAIVSGFSGNAPIAAVQGTAAAGLIAAGVGLGGVAVGIEHMAAGGKIGQKIEKSGERDRGVAPRSSRDRGGGPLVINVSYGVGGPLPEDTAREIAKVQRQGARRGGA